MNDKSEKQKIPMKRRLFKLDKKLKALFDYQKFENNERLGAIISKSQDRLSASLEDDELDIVYAAGNIYEQLEKKEENADGSGGQG